MAAVVVEEGVRVVELARSGSRPGTTSAHSSRHLLFSLWMKCDVFENDEEPYGATKQCSLLRWDCSRAPLHEPQ